jgi:hypothetical protein
MRLGRGVPGEQIFLPLSFIELSQAVYSSASASSILLDDLS